MKILLVVLLVMSIPKTLGETIDEIVVTAVLRDTELSKLPASITVLTEEDIQSIQIQHFDQLLGIAPNVNFASGASRGRFVQIRGIGERSQFKDPLDTSVGLIIDGVDFSGIGLAGTLFDIRQIEILRGPQGTAFGSNALGGLILLESNPPSDEFESMLSFGTGTYSNADFGAVISGPISQTLSGRLAFQRFTSNGFIKNNFLSIDDSNNFDEQMLKGKIRWRATEKTRVDVTLSSYDTDNGYDAFSLDNTRYTDSDEPGHDRQQSNALAFNIVNESDLFTFNVNLFREDTDLEYGFDWDWSNFDKSGVRGGENNERQRDSYGLDIRVSSRGKAELPNDINWVLGMYSYRKDVDLNYNDHWEDSWGLYPSVFSSEFSTKRLSFYSQFNWLAREQLSLAGGVRWETYDNSYLDSAGVNATPTDSSWGGRLSIEYALEDLIMYGMISQGYKAGGINGQAAAGIGTGTNLEIASFLNQRLEFQSESLLSYEAGVRAQQERLSWSLSIFHMERKAMQAKAWILFPPADWKSYLDNVDKGTNSGLEFDLTFRATDNLSLTASLGLLETKLGNLTVQDIDTYPATPVEKTNREQAHAPGYQYSVSASYLFSEAVSFNLQLEGKDKFYFSNGHDIQSDSMNLAHATLKYLLEQYELSIWGRNILDETYKTRGFYFGNNPLNGWINEPYYQFGEPRTLGVTARIHF